LESSARVIYRLPANAAPALSRPPPIAGYPYYLLGAGSAALGIAEYARSVAGYPFDIFEARWGYPLGALLVALGLAVAWRAAEGPLRGLGPRKATRTGE